MIVFRYLSRDILATLLGITGILLLIIMSGRFIKYLAQAASGALSPEFLLSIIGYRIPGFLELILPLGLFLGILLAFGRAYVDSEMSVLFACGMSPHRLLGIAMGPALLVMLAVAVLSFWVSPWGINNVEQILAQQKNMTQFDNLLPGRFQSVGAGGRVTYLERLSEDRTQMQEVFIAEADKRNPGRQTLVIADSGVQQVSPEGRYLILNQGTRFDGTPGQADFRVTRFASYGVRLPDTEAAQALTEEEALAIELLAEQRRQNGYAARRAEAEWQWRLSIPLLVPIMVLMAVPLSRVKPRQGRFVKLLPAVILYLLYLAALITAKGAIKDGDLSPEIGLWPVHVLFLLIGLSLSFSDELRRRFSRRPAAQEVA